MFGFIVWTIVIVGLILLAVNFWDAAKNEQATKQARDYGKPK